MLVWILAAVAAILALSLLVSPSLFSFGPLHGHDLVLVLGAAVIVLVVLELAKKLWRDKLGFYSTVL